MRRYGFGDHRSIYLRGGEHAEEGDPEHALPGVGDIVLGMAGFALAQRVRRRIGEGEDEDECGNAEHNCCRSRGNEAARG